MQLVGHEQVGTDDNQAANAHSWAGFHPLPDKQTSEPYKGQPVQVVGNVTGGPDDGGRQPGGSCTLTGHVVQLTALLSVAATAETDPALHSSPPPPCK